SILTLTLSPESVARHKDIKLVYTPLHGTGIKTVPVALKRMGFTNLYSVDAQNVADGNFPTVVSPNPEEPTAMKMAMEKADEVGASIVLASDPDADRVGCAVRNAEGKLILLTGNQIASILTSYLLTRWSELGKLGQNTYMVKTIVTTELMRAICDKYGIKLYNVLTGFKYIAEIVRNNEGKGTFIGGGEESNGFNCGEFVRDKDSTITCALIAECAAWLADKGKTLYDYLGDIYAEYGIYREKLVSVTKKGKEGLEEIAGMMKSYRENPPVEMAGKKVVKCIDYTDTAATGLPKSNVLQFFNEDGAVVTVRPSGTEPKIKFYFGSRGENADAVMEKLLAQFAK
ncbi:MAG: phospho-sugar mutase, partial [Bacteroidales bacterium]|nr:phospho-sugar mutase [Bacteroidales bacterium]